MSQDLEVLFQFKGLVISRLFHTSMTTFRGILHSFLPFVAAQGNANQWRCVFSRMGASHWPKNHFDIHLTAGRLLIGEGLIR